MTPQQFSEFWNKYFPLCPPVGYMLRSAYADRWFRIHTLPESKRYAETEREYEEILYRHNILLTELFGEGEPILLVATGYSSTPELEQPENMPIGIDSFTHIGVVPMHILEDGARYWHIWVAELCWQLHGFDSLLKSVADDEIENVMFIRSHEPVVYSPYDGGADIILMTPEERDRYRQQYTSWLSKHPEGL